MERIYGLSRSSFGRSDFDLIFQNFWPKSLNFWSNFDIYISPSQIFQDEFVLTLIPVFKIS